MKIEFVEPVLPSRRAWILAGSAWVVVLFLGSRYVHLQARIAHQREARLAAESRLTGSPIAAAPGLAPAYQEEALAALRRAALPEADALAELEHVAAVGVQLRSIDVNPAASVVVVELEAVSDEVLTDYLDQLNAGLPTAQWHLRRVASLSGAHAAPFDVAASGNSLGLTRSATIERRI